MATRVVETMGEQYPELRQRLELIQSVSEAEEVRFRNTIERGLSLLDERFVGMKAAGTKTLDGRAAFQLYDTFGFPVDLTEVICRERGLTVDLAGYEAALDEARKKSEFKGVEQAVEGVYREALGRVPGGSVRFTGYEQDSGSAQIVALIAGGKLVERALAGDQVEVVVGETPFYGESGGQVGDQGTIVAADGARVRVTDTAKPLAGLWVHRGVVEAGNLGVGAQVTLTVDAALRAAVRRNHSATHLLHWALHRVLGEHATQKGSLVSPERLRFDFTHNAPVTAAEVARIEALVNGEVLENHPIRTEILNMDEARQRGAMMIFEEKYGDVVRMLTMGPSTELCGGTHARATGDIGLFKITSEQGVAAGVRRLLATTGEGSLRYVQDVEHKLGQVAATLRANPEQLTERLDRLLERQKGLEREIESLQKKLLTGSGGGIDALLAGAKELGGVKVLGVKVEVSDRAQLRELAEQLRDRLGDSVVLVAAAEDDKVALVVTVAKPLLGRFQAGELIKAAAAEVGGKGGGRPDMAQAGGTNVAGLDAAVAAIYTAVSARLS